MASLSLRTRLIIILYVVSFTASIYIFYLVMSRVGINVDCTSQNQYDIAGDSIYYVQNHRGNGYLFNIDGRGKVKNLFDSGKFADDRILGVSVNKDQVYVLLRSYLEDFNESTMVTVPGYRILCMDKDLNVVSKTWKFTLAEEDLLSGFSAEDSGMYLTFVSSDGLSAKVYNVLLSNLTDVDDNSKLDVIVENTRTKKADDGRFFAEAYYSKGQFYTRTDKDIPEGPFAVDPIVEDVISNLHLSIGQLIDIYSSAIIIYIAILLIWFVVLYLITKIVQNRNRSFYYIVIAELALFFILSIACNAVARGYTKATKTEHLRFAATSLLGLSEDAGLYDNADYSDLSFYDTARYQEIKNSLTSFVKRDGNADIFFNVMMLRLKDDVVCASSSGQNHENITMIYGSDLSDIAKQINGGNRLATVDFSAEGQKYCAVAVADMMTSAEYALVGIVNPSSVGDNVVVDNLEIWVYFVLVFAVASAFVVLVWYLHMRDLAVLEQALENTALGNEIPDKPRTIGRDIKDMWDAVFEIHKRVEGMQYSKLRILEAYFRFAPKNLESVMEKNSILEIQNGDSRVINGTVATIKINIEKGRIVTGLTNLFHALDVYMKENESMMIGKESDLSKIQMIFTENDTNTIQSLVDINDSYLKSTNKSAFSVLLFDDVFNFGIVGSDDQATTFLYIEEKDLIKKISEFITSIGIGLVVTKGIIDRENYTGVVRFIGYGGRNRKGELVGLYEVIEFDYSYEKEREEKLATLVKFNEAMKLYEEKDFYLARNKFSDILKESPNDKLVRWYVFESERYLQERVEGDDYLIVHT